MKTSSKWLLMAAMDVTQQLDDLNSAAQGMAMQGQAVDYDDFHSAITCELDSLIKTLQLIADQEEEDISTAYYPGHSQPDPVDRNRAPAGRLMGAEVSVRG